MKRTTKLIFWLWLLFLVFACELTTETGEGVATRAGEGVSEPTPTVTLPPYDGPTPRPGTGNAYGRVLWNGRAAANLDLRLCQEISIFGGCTGITFATTTDDSGLFLFQDIDPGPYNVDIRLFDSDDWLYVTGGLFTPKVFVIVAGESLPIGDQHIHKLDLIVEEPADEAEVNAREVTLKWKPYEAAAYYQLYLAPDEGEAIFVNEQVNVTELTTSIPPVNCEYNWTIDAFNQDNIKIAETRERFYFTVTGQEASCKIPIVAPVDGAELTPAEGIILTWEPHPLAVRYDILMWNDSLPDRPNVLDFVEVTEPTYTIAETLDSGRYVWSVRGFNADGNEIAGSEVSDFTVK